MPRENANWPLTDLPHTDQIEQLTRWVMAEPRWVPDSVSWIHDLAEEAVSNELGRHVLRGCAAELARIARVRDCVMPTDEDWRRCKDSWQPAEARRVLAYVHGHRLRLDRQFRQLASMVKLATEVPGDQLTDDALVCALEAFAALGLRESRADAILHRLVGLADYDQWCREVQLHGLGVADHLRDQPDRIIKLSDEMVQRGEGDSDVYYWRAYAERRLGRFEQAVASIDRALATLPADRRERHAAYQQECEVIRAAQQLSGLSTTLRSGLQDQFQRLRHEQEGWLRDRQRQQEESYQRHRDELDALSAKLHREIEMHSSAARQLVPDSVRGVVSLLALFALVLSLAIITGTLALRADQAWLALVYVGFLLLGGAAVLATMGTPAVGRVGDFLRRGFRGQDRPGQSPAGPAGSE